MALHISAVTLLVDDYDCAIDFYVQKLGFSLVEDTKLSDSKRWVVVSPDVESGCRLLLAKADGALQIDAIGNQAGGRVFLFLNTDDFDVSYQKLKTAGVVFLEEPRQEGYGKVAVFQDLFGNKWDLIQPGKEK